MLKEGDQVRVQGRKGKITCVCGRSGENVGTAKVAFLGGDAKCFPANQIQLGWHKEIVEIDGEMAVLLREDGKSRTKDRQVLLSDLMNKITSQSPRLMETPLLPPPGLRYYTKKGDIEVVVWEESPQLRTTSWSDLYLLYSGNSGRFNLAFPFVVLICQLWKGRLQLRHLKCFYRTSPITSLEDELCHTNLKNVRFNGNRLCLRPDYEEIQSSNNDLTKQMTLLLNELWGGTFNDDLFERDDFYFTTSSLQDRRVDSVEAWQKASQKDPLFVLKVPWLRTEKTVRAVVKEALLGEESNTSLDPFLIKDVSQLADLIYRVEEV